MAADREVAAEDSIRVVCRFRPLNDSEEKAGSKFIVKFPSGPDDNCISIGVSNIGNKSPCNPFLYHRPKLDHDD